MSSTRALASYISKLQYEDLPPSVVEKGKIAILDVLGISLGAYPLGLSKTFLELAKDMGGGRGEATLVGDGAKVSVPYAAFGNGALSFMLDFNDYHPSESGMAPACVGALAVPAALAAGEVRGISGRELITSVVAGYECAARVIHSMDMTREATESVLGESVSVFASVGAAGRALDLDEDQMLSAVGMTGIYTMVPGMKKWVYDEGLTPKRDVKLGWAWMCMTGAFAAVSAQKGLKMLQENNILDGDLGLWRMLGMDIWKDEKITEGFGEIFHIQQFGSKVYPGCAITHAPIAGVTALVRDHGIDVGDIQGIEVVSNTQSRLGFEGQEAGDLVANQFCVPYQVSAALLGGDGGPDWYKESTARSPEMAGLMKMVSLTSDEECDRLLRDANVRMTKVAVLTKGGKRHDMRVEGFKFHTSSDELKKKFVTTVSQVADRDRVDKILHVVDNLEEVANVSELVDLLSFVPQGVH